jgi:hypothetical protein
MLKARLYFFGSTSATEPKPDAVLVWIDVKVIPDIYSHLPEAWASWASSYNRLASGSSTRMPRQTVIE